MCSLAMYLNLSGIEISGIEINNCLKKSLNLGKTWFLYSSQLHLLFQKFMNIWDTKN